VLKYCRNLIFKLSELPIYCFSLTKFFHIYIPYLFLFSDNIWALQVSELWYIFSSLLFSGTVGEGELESEETDVAGTFSGTGGSGERFAGIEDSGWAVGDIVTKELFLLFFIFK